MNRMHVKVMLIGTTGATRRKGTVTVNTIALKTVTLKMHWMTHFLVRRASRSPCPRATCDSSLVLIMIIKHDQKSWEGQKPVNSPTQLLSFIVSSISSWTECCFCCSFSTIESCNKTGTNQY